MISAKGSVILKEMDKIVVLDSGGQYCHLIARKVRELGVYADIKPIDTDPAELAGYCAIILSGGPSSVFADDAPGPQDGLFAIERPMLGICYGHQLLARGFGGTVTPGKTQELGPADLQIASSTPLFAGLGESEPVWMNHGDWVSEVPPGFRVIGMTDDCPVGAMGDDARKLYGLQFHPEVIHTPRGKQMLENFVAHISRCATDWHPEDRVQQVEAQIRDEVGDRKVLFFLSGGVDSTVAYALTVQALGAEHVHGVYVDTGFMRAHETDEIEHNFARLDLGTFETLDASDRFFGALEGVTEPERKRKIIGQLFVDVQNDVVARGDFVGHDWMLGQGTIYPDRIESGGTSQAAVIKTHHNRVAGIEELIAQGRVLEPLGEFYKDEVRALGRALGLSANLLERHPFPGPALAIRCLCAAEEAAPHADAEIESAARAEGYEALLLPVRSVGVHGDARSYAELTLFTQGPLDYDRVLGPANRITNQFRRTNRVALVVGSDAPVDATWRIHNATLTRDRVRLLQRADDVVSRFLHEHEIYHDVWQCPVVLLPFGKNGGETIALRPITSVDGMTAQVARLPADRVTDLAKRILAVDGIEAVLYDVSHKPPSTIEWE